MSGNPSVCHEHQGDCAGEQDFEPCIWPDWWPAHAGNPACGERYCRRCEMEQEHGEWLRDTAIANGIPKAALKVRGAAA